MLYVVNAGRGGQLPSILINTEIGATVTITKGEDTMSQVATNGTALFEDVEYGTWNVSSSLDGATTTDTIEVVNEFGLTLPVGKKLSSMPLKTTKLKIGGIKWILFARDHAGYPSGAQTLISEFTVDPNTTFGSTTNYQGSNLQSRMQQIYTSFSEREKSFVLQTTRKYKNGSGAYPQFSEYVFPLTSPEVGGTADAQMGTNLGFNSNADRICNNTSGSAQHWWLANARSSSVGSFGYFVRSDGYVSDLTDPSQSYGVRPACNISGDAIITSEPDDEGYYFIKGAEETTELLLERALNALEILGVETK